MTDLKIPEDLKDRHSLLHKWIYGPITEHDPMPHESSLRNELALIERIARLEADKQEARRIGLEFALHLATETADWCIEEQEKGYLGAMRVADAIKRALSKPTAAKQGVPS